MKICTLVLGQVPAQERFLLLEYGRPVRQHHIAAMVFRRMLYRLFPVPVGLWANFCITVVDRNGRRVEGVVLNYDNSNPLSGDFVDNLLAHVPRTWDEEARHELLWFDRSVGFYESVVEGKLTEEEIPEAYRGSRPPVFSREMVHVAR